MATRPLRSCGLQTGTVGSGRTLKGNGFRSGVTSDNPVILGSEPTPIAREDQHPWSSQVRPSDADVRLTKDVIQTGNALRIKLKEHIIVNTAGDDYCVLTGVEGKEEKPVKLPIERQQGQEVMKSFAWEVIGGILGVLGWLMKGALFIEVHLVVATIIYQFFDSGAFSFENVFIVLMVLTGYLTFLQMFFRPIRQVSSVMSYTVPQQIVRKR